MVVGPSFQKWGEMFLGRVVTNSLQHTHNTLQRWWEKVSVFSSNLIVEFNSDLNSAPLDAMHCGVQWCIAAAAVEYILVCDLLTFLLHLCTPRSHNLYCNIVYIQIQWKILGLHVWPLILHIWLVVSKGRVWNLFFFRKVFWRRKHLTNCFLLAVLFLMI